MRKKIDSRMKGKKDKKKIYDGTFQTVKLESFGKSSVSKITDKETRLSCLKCWRVSYFYFSVSLNLVPEKLDQFNHKDEIPLFFF